MNTAFVFFTGAACSLLLLAAAKLAGHYRGLAAGRWLLVVITGVFFYLLRHVLPPVTPLVDFLAVWPSLLVPGAFWLFAHSLCCDTEEFPRWGWLLIGLDIAINTLSISDVWRENWQQLDATAYLLAQPLKLGLLAAGVITLLRQYQSDLVEARRNLRLALMIAIGGYMLVVVMAEFLFSYQPVPTGIPALHAFLASLLSLGACLWLLAPAPGALAESLPRANEPMPAEDLESPAPAPMDEGQQRLAERLEAHMQAGGYRHTGLTIRELAEQLGEREHVLRSLINRHLGYRNFNEFLNRYRIDEASARLADPQQAHLPVLTIALDIGYRSLSPFNAAFKRRHNQTPTEYRRERLPA
ncbi:helix-turn-helix transcriptional regulator [Microbulbifer yueqingensis]|uniref:Transcriptional regulator, AraC family n=1 Tax=Microbulbifer yueqingensis TaxID=658219 RepID=A0A1G8VUE4_9GAMM|nr:helix-turn-helix transcriptional regulator [Microbulbifer yueqingensis]SDJ69629.1 transcriptional regulator, AraC family [Microbulbifer yueqingensis]